MNELFASLRAAHVGEILLAVAILAVVIDYLFATDWPCYLGYFLFGLGVFILLSNITGIAAASGLASWLILAVLHRTWLWKILSNRPEQEAATAGEPTGPNEIDPA